MRILFHHRIASRDGQAVHIEELIAALQRQGHETILVGPPGLLKNRFGTSDLWIDRLKRSIPGAIYELLELFYNLKAFIRLRAAVLAHRPDVIYERFSLFLFAGLWVRQLYRLPILLEVNSPLYEERRENDGFRLGWLGKWAQGHIWNTVDHVLPVTAVLGRCIVAYGVPAERITVIPNGVDPKRFNDIPDNNLAKAHLNLPPRLVLGFTGFVRTWNAVDRIVDFVASHQAQFDLHILVVGDGPARPYLEERARARGVGDRLTITGIVGRDAVANYIGAFDIAVIPGMTPYSSPLKLFEYLQLGRAIVAPNTENIREILTHEQDALLFDPAADGALEATLLRLCLDSRLRSRLGECGQRTIYVKSLTWDFNAEKVIALANRAISPAAETFDRASAKSATEQSRE